MATTKAKALLVEMANSLAAEATAAGKTALATALTEFGSEINADSVTDDSLFMKFDGTASSTSGKGTTWANILHSAAAVVHSKGINALNDIKSSQSTIATETAAIAVAEGTIATKQTVIANKQTAIESYQKRMRELAEGAGIRTITPSELIGLAKMYQVMVEQGKILDDGTPPVSDTQQAQAKAKFQELAKKVAELLALLGPPKF